MINQRSIHLDTVATLPSLPRIAHLGWERADSTAYRHSAGNRAISHAAVQITLAGEGAVLSARRAVLQRVPRGRALVFVARTHHLIYGYPPDALGAPYDFLYANMEGAAATLMLADLVAAHGHVLRIDPEHAAVRALIGLLPAANDARRRISAAESARLAFDLFAVLVASNTLEAGGESLLLDQAMAWLRERLDRPVDVAAAARACGVSREHLSRLFARRLGVAPATWLRRQRLAQAERLLVAGVVPVAEVARRCGFTSASHFAALFRRLSGVSPGDFRRG